MSGIYIHIPFCQSRCIYCDFFSTSHLAWRTAYVEALAHEMESRKEELLPHARIYNTMYIGGGTPSTLAVRDLQRLFSEATRIYPLEAEAEVTIEANPDDVTPEWIAALRDTPVNRISMGTQTFDDQLLRFLHRRHDSRQACQAVELLQTAGYTNLSLDLIYGIPGQTREVWQRDVNTALSLGVPHLSAYSLMFEEGTRLTQMRDEGQVQDTDDETAFWCYEHLCEALAAAGLEHYEISNFARPGFASRHNSSYWCALPYLGFGAGAHSYDGERMRRWNAPNLQQYIQWQTAEETDKANLSLITESEQLSDTDLYNEFVMTRLRTREGFSLKHLRQQFGQAAHDHCLRQAQPHIEQKKLQRLDQRLSLTRAGIFVSNQIMSDLFQ